MQTRQQGFTRIELLLVLLILGGLAGVTVPRVHKASVGEQYRELDLRLEAVRGAIEAYRAEHGGAMPGIRDGRPDDEIFVLQLTERSDADGSVNPEEGRLGPYLTTVMPSNPLNELALVKVLGAEEVAEPDERSGWIFHLRDGRFFANLRGSGSDGEALVDR